MQRRRAQARSRARIRRLAGLVSLAVVVLVTLLLTAFGSGGPTSTSKAALAPARRLLPAGPPRPQVIALEGALRIQLPVSQARLTALGYHGVSDGSLALQPLGTQANEGTLSRLARSVFGGSHRGLRYYQLSGGEGPATSALDVGAAPGTDVYSPIDGTVVAIKDNILSGKRHGVVLDLQPTNAPSMLVSLTHLRPDPSLTVGSPVSAGSSVIGTLVSFKDVERQALARYTQDVGDHVAIEVRQATALALP
jgi:hypothetical protein